MMDLECEELLHELRHHTLEESGKTKSAEILPTDERLQEHVTQHRATVLKEMQSPQSVQHLAGATANFGLAFLPACLGVGAFRVVENERLGSVIDTARSRQQAIELKVANLKRDIVDMLEQTQNAN